MNIEDIRLTEEEILEIWGFSKGFHHDQMPSYLNVANTATDKAIKKVIESLENRTYDDSYFNNRMAGVWDWIEALKKLVEGV